MAAQLQSLLGLFALPLIAWILSERRGAFTPSRMGRILVGGLALQIAIAGVMLNVPAARGVFDWLGGIVTAVQAATNEGMRLVFGYLAGGPQPFDVTRPEATFILAFQALPLILVISALSRLLYHWGVLQQVVAAFAWLFQKSLGIAGPVGTSAAANIFVGMVEAPLLIRPYLATMSRAGLFATMTVGMAGIAGTVLVIYATIIGTLVPGAAGHLIVASVISAPAGLLLAQIMVPEDDATSVQAITEPVTIDTGAQSRSSMDAIAQGTAEGVSLLANVAAMLIVAVALVAIMNQLLAFVLAPFGVTVRFETLMGWVFAPLAWLIGVPSHEMVAAGSLLGVKTVLNEFVAYLQLAGAAPGTFSDRTRLIMTYALCGFANFASLGILIGGVTAMVPERRAEVASLGGKTMVSGTLATLMTAAVVGVLTPG